MANEYVKIICFQSRAGLFTYLDYLVFCLCFLTNSVLMMEEDIQKCCRICLDVENDHVSILGDPTIHLHLKSCLGTTVTLNDGLPKAICGSCVSQLSDFYNFQLNARCSQDWLETTLQEMSKKTTETKTPIQPLPDSEYNSDSLLEFLNNTANIEEYLNNLGREDIPSIVNLLDRNETSIPKPTKVPTPNKKDSKKDTSDMEIDVLESDIIIVKEIVMKKSETKIKMNQANTVQQKSNQMKAFDKSLYKCFACDTKFENMHRLSQHLSICDLALRTCTQCLMLFDSKLKMQQHFATHNKSPLTCSCGKLFQNKDNLQKHQKICSLDHGAAMGCSYRCKECGEVFKERFLLYKHAKIHIQKSEQRVCDICGRCFVGAEALSKHKQEEHEKRDLQYR